MALVQRHKWDWDEVCAALGLLDPLLFALQFMAEELTIPVSRLDLPAEWRGRQVISLEQRKMFYDGAVYRLWRDVMPEAAAESSQKVALRTSRKIGKTLEIEAALVQIPITNTLPGTTEGMFHTPRDNHMAPIKNRLEARLINVPLFRMMFRDFDAATGIMNWRSGWIWHFRIEGMCLSSDTLIADAGTGELFAIGDMLEGPRPQLIHTVDPETYELRTTADYDVTDSGEQELFEVITEDNYSVKATANHPFLTPSGWKRLDQLSSDDVVAVTGRLLADGASGLTGEQARLLGYFVGDGCTTGTLPLFTNNDLGVIDDWRGLCEQYPGIEVKELQEFQYSAAGKRGTNHSALISFLREHGVWGKRADAKRVPKAVWTARPDVVAEFLAGLISCDGSIAFKANGSVVVSFASINRGLAEDVAYLLLRFGIKTRLEHREADGNRKFGAISARSKELWSLRLSGVDDLQRFCENIPLRGRKSERQKHVLDSVLPNRIEGGHGLAVPEAIVRREMGRTPGMSVGRINDLCGTTYRNGPAGVRYTTVMKMNAILKSQALGNLLRRDVLWVKVKSIKSVGIDRTYDLTVPGTHSFVGNQCILHNSGSGTNMVGLRAACMIGDEADYSQTAPYVERKQTALPGCAELWGGVPRGVRGVFWQVCNTVEGKSWSIHRYDIRANPLYHSQREFADQISGDWYSQRVQTQVLGRDGEEAVSSFPIVPVNPSAKYVIRKFTAKEYERYKNALPEFLDLGIGVIEEVDAWMIHLDYGYSPSPTQLGISYLRGGLWQIFCRMEIMRVDTAPMANLIAIIDTRILPKRAALIVMDAHGQGRGVLSALQTEERWAEENYGNRAVAVGFETSTPVPNIKLHRKCKQMVRQENDGYWTCDNCHERIFDEKNMVEAQRQTKAYLTDVLKEAFANGARLLGSGGKDWPGGISIAVGDDAEVIEELAGTTEITSQGGQTRYIMPKEGQDHMTDMFRCLASGAERYITMITEWDQFKADDYGWGENPFDQGKTWAASWANTATPEFN